MQLPDLEAKRKKLETEREAYIRDAQAQIERFNGAIAVLTELIEEAKAAETKEKTQ